MTSVFSLKKYSKPPTKYKHWIKQFFAGLNDDYHFDCTNQCCSTILFVTKLLAPIVNLDRTYEIK